MNVVNVGTDKTLVGGKKLGDAIERHRKYGEFVDHLDIIVYTNKKDTLTKEFKMSDNVIGFPTNSRGKIFFFFDVIKLFEKINAKYNVDLVVCQDPFVPGLIGLWLKQKYKKVKLLIHFHGDFWGNPYWLKERLLNNLFLLISKFTVPRADGIRVMSEGQKEKLIKKGVSNKKISIISTPIDLEKFKMYDTSHVELIKQENNNKKIILFVGRGDEVKDLPTAIKAMELVLKKHIKVNFIVIGSWGEWEKRLKFKSYPWLSWDYLKQETLIDYYHASSVVINSSTSESFGKVLVEANASAKPVVATATTGAKDIIKDGYNGFLVPIGDVNALADKIVYLLENEELLKNMGENGRKRVKEKFSNNTAKIIQFWHAVLES